MKQMRLIFGMMCLLMVSMVVTSCDEDIIEEDLTPVASFQSSVDEVDFFLVAFINASSNATSYSWDFGDEVGTSTEENPQYTYTAGGTYTVTLIASDAAGLTASFSSDITITDPDEALTLLAGASSKTWKLLRDGAAMGIGPDEATWYSWWALNNDGSRSCLFDDEFIYHRDGTYEYQANGTFWAEADYYTADSDKADLLETCIEETAENLIVDGVDYSAWLSSDSHSYTYDASTNNIALTGTGAWMLLYKLGTTDYNAKGTTPPASTSFSAILGDGGDSGVDTLTVGFQYDGQYWKGIYVSYDDANDEPALAAEEPAPDFTFAVDGLAVTFTNASKRSESYSWDFGDGNTSTDESPVHTYAEEGAYNVVLSATGNDFTNTVTKEVIISTAEFSADVLSSESGKIWKLAGEASYKVGPTAGSGEWWGGLDAAGVTERECQMDDEFIFTDGGAYAIDLQAETWAEAFMGGTNACIDPSTLSAPFNGFGAGTDYTFAVTEATGDTPAMVTISGSGAYVGWTKGTNTGDYPDDGSATELVSAITYQVVSYAVSGDVEVLTLAVDTSDGAGTGFWTITIKSE